MRHSTRWIQLFVVAALFLVGVGCGFSKTVSPGKVKVITTLFPQYDFVRTIGKDKVAVTLLLPPGVEAHSYEPSPQDMVRIRKADLFIYTGETMEPWAHKIITSMKASRFQVVDSSKGIALLAEADHDEHEAHENHGNHEHHEAAEEHHHHGGKDPHIWLDPVYAQQMVDNIVAGLMKADPENKAFYQKNGQLYKDKLQALNLKMAQTFQNAPHKKIIYGGHFAFGYFARRYGLEHISPYNGFAPDAEPTPQRIAELVKNMEAAKVKVIYYEELIEPKVAKVIAKQTGAKMLLLHGAHNVSKSELASGITYLKIMESNLQKLKIGLGIQ